jgi:DNA invertase Pin-like site-specific DNA recombinase
MTTPTPAPLVAYLRVSTSQQGRSGLGIEAQRAALAQLSASTGRPIVAEYVEIATGKGADALDRRPILAAALRAARRAGGAVAIAKLDRLSRDVAFIAGLMSQRVAIVLADAPTADPFMLHIYAAVAEEERRKIAARTAAALQAAKSRGVVLGNRVNLREAGARGAATRGAQITAGAQAHAGSVGGVIGTIRAGGVTTLAGIAAELNRRGIATAQGGDWQATQVKRVLARLSPTAA